MADKDAKATDTQKNTDTGSVNESFEKMLEEAQSKVGDMLVGAEEKAKEIVDEAQKKAEEIMATASEIGQAEVKAKTSNGPTKGEIELANEKVSVELFKDNNLYRDDVYVAVNGENIKIQRGKPVKIDQKFKEVLDNSRRQDAAAADLNEELKDDFDQKSTALE